MGLESNLTKDGLIKEGGNIKETSIDLTTATLATVGAYNLAGFICHNTPFNQAIDTTITVGLLSAGAIGGYKLRSGIKKIKEIKKKRKRNIARVKTLREMSKDEEFLERQGLKGEFGKTRKNLKYLLTVPLGGGLGYLAGAAGIIPLCVYFGQHYNWDEWPCFYSGRIAGPITGAYAFAEMTFKKQKKRIASTTGSLIGIGIGYLANPNLRDIAKKGESALGDHKELWTGLAICTGLGLLGGCTVNKIYKKLHYKK